MGVEVSLLGGFGISVDGRALDTGPLPRRCRELVALLALAPGGRLTRDEVVEALFGHLSPAAGAANLHKSASLSRRHLGDRRALVLEQGSVVLWPDAAVATDVERFEAAAERALAARDPLGCRAAAARYTGPLLPDDRYRDWTIARRGHLERLFAELLRAAGEWRQLLALDPCDEEAARGVMRAHAAAGNRPPLDRELRRLRDALARGPGTRPSAETLRLHEELTRGPPAVAPVDTAAPIVGRAVERVRIRAAWMAAGAGRGGGVLVRGEAGIGKTRLCEALLAEAAAAGWTTLRGSGSRLEADVSYGPLAEAVERLLLDRPDLAERVSDAARAALARLAPAGGRAARDDGRPVTRRQVASAVGQLVAAAARERGVVVFLDDLHAADGDTVRVVGALAGAARFQPVLVMAALRAGEERGAGALARAELLGTRRAIEIELGPLSADEGAELIAAVRGRPVSREAAARMWARAGGNPFLLRELAATPGAERVDAAPPPAVGAAVAARLAGLDAAVRAALEAAAVLGEAVTGDELARLADGAGGTPDAAEAAVAAGILEEHDGGYRFRHALVREALLERLSGPGRARADDRAAEALIATCAPPARVARHLLAAHRPRDARPWLVAAARRAASAGAVAEAAGVVERALRIDGADAESLALRADLAYAAGDPSAAARYDAALERAAPEAIGPLLVRQARAHVAGNDPAGASACLAAATVTTPADRALRRLIEAQVAWMSGDLDGAEGAARQARSVALAHGVSDVVLGATSMLDLVLHQRGRWSEGLRRDLRHAARSPVLATVVYDAHLCGAEADLYGGRPYAEVKSFARALADRARKGGATRGLAFAITLLGEAQLLCGELGPAQEHLEEGARLHRRVGASGGEALARQRLAQVLLARDRRSAAGPLLADALRLASCAGPMAWHLVSRVYATMVAAADGPEAALAVVDEAEREVGGGMAQACPPCSVPLWIEAAIACADAGRVERAAGYVARAEPWVAALWPRGGWNAAVDEARGHVAVAGGDPAAARARLERAAATFGLVGQRLDARRCRDAAGRLAPAPR